MVAFLVGRSWHSSHGRTKSAGMITSEEKEKEKENQGI